MQRTVRLLEEQTQKKKWTVTENKEVIMCYFEADQSQCGHRKRMHNIWLSKHPDSTISKQRLADQSNVIMRRNLLTSVKIEEIQRRLSAQACHTESNTTEQPTSCQPDLTHIRRDSEEIPQQQHSLNQRQMELKSRLIAHVQQEHRLRLPTLKNTHHNKDLTQIFAAINKVLCTIYTATIEQANKPVVVQHSHGGYGGTRYKVQSNKTSTQGIPPKKLRGRLQQKIDK